MSEERILVTALGRDRVGIVAGISAVLAEHNVNIIELTSAEMGGSFVMVMLVDIAKADVSMADLQAVLKSKGEEIGVQVTAQHEDVFRYMHRI
ncbi:MAG: ACT domain-containing protein [Nitrososphaerales archaeon]